MDASFKGKISSNSKKHSVLWPLSCQLGLRNETEDQTKFTNKNLAGDIISYFQKNLGLLNDARYKKLRIPGLKAPADSTDAHEENVDGIGSSTTGKRGSESGGPPRYEFNV